MAKTAAAKVVPVRLAQRYPNGSMISYSGRAIAHDENSVCVLIKEEFEAGSRLSIMAPFLTGITTAKVFSVTRSTAQPGFYEIFLQIGEGIEPALPNKAPSLDQSSEKSERRTAISARSAPGGANAEQPASDVPPQIAEAAALLADELDKHPSRRLSEVLAANPPESRAMTLLVAVAAAIHLLEKKGHVEARRLLGILTDTAAHNAKEAVKQ